MRINNIDIMIRSPRSRALFFRPSAPQSITVQAGETVYPVVLRRNRQARRYTLRIRPGSREAVLTMPLRGNVSDAAAFAQNHADWLATRIEKMPRSEPFADGAAIPLRGIRHRIVHRFGARGTVWTETAESGEPLLNVAGGADHTARRVQDFLKREVRQRPERPYPPYDDPRPVEPLGLVQFGRRAVIFVAPHSRAALRARLSRRA